jgi:Mrp family chromosome partitioning ATPase
MHNILNKNVLLTWGILKNQWLILSIAAAVIAITTIALILITLKKRKSKKSTDTNPADAKESPYKWPEENYEFITDRIKRVGRKYKSILFASAEIASLPITIPVNVAIGLAKNERRCLLIDLDLKRDAIAEVFELDSNKNGLTPKAIRTEFENLWVWPGHNFTQLKQMNIKLIVQKAQRKFDFILINAPSLANSPDRKQIISAADAAFICTKTGSEVKKLAELIKPLNCVVIGNIQIP